MTKRLSIRILLVFACLIAASNCFSQTISSGNFGFIENKGQIIDQNNNVNATVKFLLCRPGFNVQLRQTGFSYDTYVDEVGQFFQRHYHRVDVELLNCNKNAELMASDSSSAQFNYFTGAKNGGIQGVHHYQKIVYRNIYPNIDLEFYTQNKTSAAEANFVGVEYQFVVHPGGNVNDIQLAYKGASNVSLENNTISVKVSAGSFTEKIPSSYLKASRQKIKVDYQTIGENIFSFHLPSNVAITSDLVIDPIPDLQWGSYYGGGNNDNGNCIAVDASGNIYIAGYTESINNIATAGAYQSTLEGSGAVNYGDAFVAKFDPTGSTLLWGTYYGGGISYNEGDFGRTGYKYGSATAYAIAVDASGNVYIAGQTSDSNGIATPGAYQTTFKNNGSPAFIAKFTTNGNLAWGTFYGKPYTDKTIGSNTVIQSIALDATGSNIYVAGTTSDDEGIATAGSFNPAYIYGETCGGFVAKFDTSGKSLLWGTYFGDNSGNNRTFVNAITVDAANNVYITGNTECTAIATSGAYHTSLTGGANAFIAKLNASLSGSSQLLWCTYYGGSVLEHGNAIAVDADHNVYITGFTDSDTGVATKGAYLDTFKTYSESAFIAKLDSTGSKRIWGTYYGATGFISYGTGITLDACKSVYITGYTNCTSGISTTNAYKDTLNGGSAGTSNAFVAKFDSSAKSLLWGTYYGANSTSANGIVLSNGNLYIGGTTSSVKAISSSLAWQNVLGGDNDAMVAEFTNIGVCTACSLSSMQINSPSDSVCSGSSITLSAITPGSANIKYTWSPGGQHTSSIRVSPSTLTKYVVTVQDTVAGCSLKDSITIHVITAKVTPAVTISSPSSTICAGAALTFTASPVNGGTAPAYQWRVNNQKAGTNSTQFTDNSISNNDMVTCILTSNVVCASPDTALSNSISVTVTALPSAGTIETPSDNVCIGTGRTLSLTGSTGNVQWQTSPSNVIYTNILGATNSTYRAMPTQDVYFRAYTTNGNCADTATAIELFAIPAPTVSFTDSVKGNMVSFSTTPSAGVAGYFWDFGDSTTSTDENPVHTFDSSKVYYVCVTVTNNSNCSFTSCLDISTLSTGIHTILPGSNWVIYPNPFSDQIYIDNSQPQTKVESIRVVDVLGREVFAQQMNNGIISHQILNVSTLTDGVYFLVLRTQGGDYVKPLIKE